MSRCPTCNQLHRRTHPQNARYWALLHVLADKVAPAGMTFSAEVWHLEFKRRFLGCDDVTLPTGRVMPVPKSSADLDVAAFGDYMTQVEAFANERGAFLEDEKWGQTA